MQELKIFSNPEFGEIRSVKINDENYFVGADVSKALEYARPSEAVTAHCKGTVKWRIPTNGGEQEMNVIPIGDILRLVVKASEQSKNSKIKEKAERYERWIFDEVLPVIHKTGTYRSPNMQVPKEDIRAEKREKERLASVNNAVKILMPILKQAGCDAKIQLLTAKSLYEKSGVLLPIEIAAEKKYYDTKYIARRCGMFTKSNKPAYQAASMIIKKLDINTNQYEDTWETNGKWQGTVRKYDESVIIAVQRWLNKNSYPEYIEYTQYDGQIKRYHVLYKPLSKEVA